MELFAVKPLSATFKEIALRHDGYFYCLSCLVSFRTEKKLKKHNNVCKIYHKC